MNLSNENTQLLNAILSPVISDDNEQVIQTIFFFFFMLILNLNYINNFPREIFFFDKKFSFFYHVGLGREC